MNTGQTTVRATDHSSCSSVCVSELGDEHICAGLNSQETNDW